MPAAQIFCKRGGFAKGRTGAQTRLQELPPEGMQAVEIFCKRGDFAKGGGCKSRDLHCMWVWDLGIGVANWGEGGTTLEPPTYLRRRIVNMSVWPRMIQSRHINLVDFFPVYFLNHIGWNNHSRSGCAKHIRRRAQGEVEGVPVVMDNPTEDKQLRAIHVTANKGHGRKQGSLCVSMHNLTGTYPNQTTEPPPHTSTARTPPFRNMSITVMATLDC
ncbi:uncharacterized protein B0T23DRAFT_8647 [Neurospora hispaniola]|uniref:Uncharacterized protein n=1 Tax=Neurospora hispaniola TaxID=588809 RepID=A0AAJ0MUW4_9PEZI|nr:hypothetical protein B0T23DRAFT_8647 [Neurospora hispaniola]